MSKAALSGYLKGAVPLSAHLAHTGYPEVSGTWFAHSKEFRPLSRTVARSAATQAMVCEERERAAPIWRVSMRRGPCRNCLTLEMARMKT